MSLRIFVQAATGQFEAAMEEAAGNLKDASMAAAHRAADILKTEGRADIAAAGFSKKWQKALATKVYPENALSAHPTIEVYNPIPFSGIFEEGGTIFGKPLLWLPLPDAPKGSGGNRMTPATYVKQVGPLIPIFRAGRRPLLAAKRRSATATRKKGEVVPLFVGIDAVTLRDRFSIREISEKVAARLPELFAAEFN